MEMQMEFIRKLPTPQELKEEFPVTEEIKKVKEERDKEIADVFMGKSDKFLMIIGPCSADNEEAVCDYMNRLAKVQEKVKEKIFIIPRVYTNKPRTKGTGYKGMLHQPDPEGHEDMLEGLIAIRQMHTRVVRETGFTCAEEMLYPGNHRYLSDLLSYIAVGARSVEDQEHRIVSSGVGIPVGMKNPPSGDISVMMNAITAAQSAQDFIYRGWEVRTPGNPLAHSIMRGYIDEMGHAKPNYYYENLTNAGLYVCSKEVLDYVAEPTKIDFEKVVLKHFVEEGKAYAYRSSEYVKDCGTPDRFYSVENDLKNGIIHGKSLANPQKCIFLDRDGTINEYRGLVTKTDELELEEDAASAIQKINSSRYLAICVTNQPVIARGDTTLEELKNIHNKMETLLGKGGAYLDALYFCPHHPDKGFEGEVPEFKIDCDCRKPKIGLLKKAEARFNIDPKKSWFIGDTDRDIQTGINGGCRTIFLDTTPNPPIRFKDAKPDFVCHSLTEAVNLILTLERDDHD